MARPIKKYLSEEGKMYRLRKSIIKKSIDRSRLLNSSTENLSFSEKVEKIRLVALTPRGGTDYKQDYTQSDNLFQVASVIENIVLKLSASLK
jgi:hypothetical protein